MTLQLVVSDLEVKRGARSVVRELSFAVASGDVLLLTGANGAGKTTLIRALAGFLKPAGGTIRLTGVDDDREIGEYCHYVGHLNGIKASMSAVENLTFWGTYLAAGEAAAELGARIETALEHMNLEALADIPAGYLSAGQKRRLGLARLLVAARPVWLLDEPTVSLDASSVALLAGVIEAHVRGGGMVIAATHLNLGLAHARELQLVGVGQAARTA